MLNILSDWWQTEVNSYSVCSSILVLSKWTVCQVPRECSVAATLVSCTSLNDFWCSLILYAIIQMVYTLYQGLHLQKVYILWGVQIPLLFLAYVNLSLIFKSKSKIVLIQCLGSFSCSTTVSYPFRNKSFVLNVALLYPLVIIMLLSSSRWCVCYSIGTKQQCWHHGAFMCREVLNLVKLATSCRITAGTLSSLDGMVLHLISDNKLTYILLCTLFKV